MNTVIYIFKKAGCPVVYLLRDACHTGRARSRNNSRHKLDYQQVLDALKAKGIAIRLASPKLVMEEAPESYKVAQLAARQSVCCGRSGCSKYKRVIADVTCIPYRHNTLCYVVIRCAGNPSVPGS